MGHRTEPACIEIPPHVFHRDIKFLNSFVEFIEVGLALGATDDFTDFREKHIHGTHCLAVLILLHIESLDFLRIIGKDDRFLEMFFHEEAFMLALKVGSPINRELELMA